MTRKFGFMKTDLAKRLIQEIAEGGLSQKITFHVMGEPTLHPDFFEILEFALTQNLDVGLTTNGGGFASNRLTRLHDYALHQIDISLQTPDAKSFELRYAKALSFDDYLSGILDFFASYHSKHPDTIFKFRFLNTFFPQKSLQAQRGKIEVINSTRHLRETFSKWAMRIYEIKKADEAMKDRALKKINSLKAWRWNVTEVYPNVFFETYMLEDWGHAFDKGKVIDAWGGYCFGMRDHFAVLYSGDVTLCCVDFDGKTSVGSVASGKSLLDILSSDEVGRIISAFNKNRLQHPYCKRCLGSHSRLAWAVKPILSQVILKNLKPFFYQKTRLF